MKWLKEHSFVTGLSGLAIAFAILVSGGENGAQASASIVVEEGDSLWALARSYGDAASGERWIASVRRLNGLESTSIKAGQVLFIPASEAPSAQGESELAGGGQ